MPYLDHAATSFPKAPGVAAELARFVTEDAGNAGRGVHGIAQRAANAIEDTRLALARLLGIAEAKRLALVPGATHALNAALHGVLAKDDRVLLGPDAHNSVLRPLHVLAQQRGVSSEEVRTDDVLRWDLQDLEAKLRAAPRALVAVSHGSNVTGAVQDLETITRLAHAHGARVLVDAAQTVGGLEFVVGEVDLLAFSGHKGLLGPTGTGGLYVRAGLELTPFVTGGTGTRSEDETPPRDLPAALEVGTPNAAGFAALGVAVAHVASETPAALHASACAWAPHLRTGLSQLPGLELFAADQPGDLPVASFRLPGWGPAELAVTLDAMAGIAVRPGVHCAPRAHRRLGTLPGGAVRASLGPSATEADVEALLEALRSLG